MYIAGNGVRAAVQLFSYFCIAAKLIIYFKTSIFPVISRPKNIPLTITYNSSP